MSVYPYLLLISLLLASMPASATSRMGAAAVVTEAGAPCFRIAQEEERSRGKTRLKRLFISEQRPSDWETIWVVTFPNASPGDPDYQLPNNGCLRYGDVPAGVEASQAKALQPGKTYSVGFMGRPPSASDPTSLYDAQFCVLADGAGGLRAVQLPRGERSRTDTSCEQHAVPK